MVLYSLLFRLYSLLISSLPQILLSRTQAALGRTPWTKIEELINNDIPGPFPGRWAAPRPAGRCLGVPAGLLAPLQGFPRFWGPAAGCGARRQRHAIWAGGGRAQTAAGGSEHFNSLFPSFVSFPPPYIAAPSQMPAGHAPEGQ